MTENNPIDLDIEGLEDPVEIGVGGFATVFKAYQPAFRRTVAVKVLATLNLDDAARERFERECQAMGSLSEHPNIVTVYGAGFTSSGRPYLVMAYLPGGSLQERIDRAPIPWQDATLAGVHLAGALETAHRAQIVHRDIKPGNVLMSTYGDAQLTDFGIARISGGHETRSGVITASMAHAPPEVLDGQRPTIAADVYSLGSTIFELMYGQPAFSSQQDESMVPMLRRILTDPPPDLRPRGIPDQVCQVIERAMAKKPEQRQASAVQFGRELQAARRALGLEPGKLTVPADVSVDVEQGQEISFVAAPFTGSIDTGAGAPPSPAAAAAMTGPVAGAPVTSPYVAPAAYTAPPYTPPADPGAGYGTGAPPPYVPTGPIPGTVPPKKKTGLLIGIAAAVVVALLVVVGVVLATSNKTTVAGPDGSTTTAVLTTTTVVTPTSTTEVETTTTAVATYTAEMETQFIEACVKNPQNTRLFCRCVFKGIKEKIPYDRFLQIESDVDGGGKLADTEVQPIIVDCSNRNLGGGTPDQSAPAQ